MVLGFNLVGLLVLAFPPLLYAWIIYISSPYKSLSLKTSLSFVVGGLFSVVILDTLSFLTPYWNYIYVCDPFWQQFWVTAPKEEISKFLMFLIMYKGLNDKSTKHPITCMFYMGMIGLGFALIENINYIARYGFEVLKYRTFGAVLVHMICGLLLGYWIGMSKIKKSKFKERTISSIYLSSRPKLKSILYTIMGLLTAGCFHGLWNYNILIFTHYSTPIAILMLMVGFLACKLLSRDLISQYQKSIKITPLPSIMDFYEEKED
tara:strand:- start:731 stop:1519 length:789 start_codon:yes stop_codon:yes gene_type:complete